MNFFKFVKVSARSNLRRAGYEISRIQPMNSPMLRRTRMINYHGVQTVLDLGANMGQFGAEIRDMGFHGRIIFVRADQRRIQGTLETIQRRSAMERL